MQIEKKLAELGLEPREPTIPATAPLKPWTISGNLLYLSGAGPQQPDGSTPVGKLGREFTTEQGYGFARSIALAHLGAIKDALDDLDRVVRVVKVLGMVNCTEDFAEQPQVINGYSDLLVELWGEPGRHSRSAVGMQQLPGGMPVEIEAIFEFE